ncbi:Class I glutamine amidotransferase-like superfamily protein [Euphorbia peplus]|nr:Class I glutamine amidotransferase-like superfamily protein [Euphorbia peplus]
MNVKVEDQKRYGLLLAAKDSEYVKKVYGGYFNVFVAAFGEEVSGSPFDAYANDFWILKLCFLLQTLDAMEKKVLGICFGHQVLCRALGGKVGKANTGWDIGLRKVKIVKDLLTTTNNSILNNNLSEIIPKSLTIIECHQDEVWEVPIGAQVIAFSDKTGVEMFNIGDHILGIQGHPEYTQDILFNLVDRLLNNNSIDFEFAQNAKFGFQLAEPDRKSWGKICKNFLKARM